MMSLIDRNFLKLLGKFANLPYSEFPDLIELILLRADLKVSVRRRKPRHSLDIELNEVKFPLRYYKQLIPLYTTYLSDDSCTINLGIPRSNKVHPSPLTAVVAF